jgi:DNA-binding response OmpR family regulator
MPTVLVVDDDASHRYTTRLMLEHAGFEVVEAATGEEALHLAGLQPHVVLLDVHLPDADGMDLCRTLKTSRRTATIPVLHVTALYPGSAERAESLAAGADGYLTRPLDAEQLIATIQAVLGRRSV